MKKGILIAIGIILLIGAIQSLTKGESNAEGNTIETPEPKKEAAAPKKKTPSELMDAALKENISAESLTLNGTLDSEPYSPEISFLANENLSTNMTVEGMKNDIKDALYTLKESGYAFDTISINVSYPLVDQYGNVKDGEVIKATYSGETLNKLGDDKHALNNDNLSTIADNWWAHKAIK